MLAPWWHIQGEARSQQECGLGVLHMSPPWVEGPVHDQIGVVGSQWAWEQSYRRSHRECVQHWAVYSWEANHMVGKSSCFAQHGDRLYFPMLLLPNLPRRGLDKLFDLRQTNELDPPQQWRW